MEKSTHRKPLMKQLISSRSSIVVLLVALALTAYFQLFSNHFINFDDPGYVTNNTQVRFGLSLKTLLWSMTAMKESNWHPLTWISHALDCSLFGLDEKYHHAMNLLLPIVSSILVFVAFDRMTQARWQSGFVALVFAIHPLHVESVAWIAERKDVLSGLFWMLTMIAYTKYVRSPTSPRYLLALGLFALGLLAKPMLVSLPFVLVLLDYWPLDRFRMDGPPGKSQHSGFRQRLVQIVGEKIPFMVLALASSVVTYIVQQKGGSMGESGALPLVDRIANAIISYVQYVRKSLLPTDLSFFYPHPGNNFAIWEVGIAVLSLILVSWLAWKLRKQHRYLLVGWFWFLGTLVPVIGIVQVGLQAMADRYMYIPIIGLSSMIAWGIPALIDRLRIQRSVLAGVFVVVVILMVWGTRVQAAYWKDNITLYEHALAVTSGNHVALTNLGTALADSGRDAEAITFLLQAFRLRPGDVLIRSNLARSLAAVGRNREALEHYSWLLAHVQPDPRLHIRMGDVLASEGQTEEAMKNYSEAVRLDSTDVLARSKLAGLYSQLSRFDDTKSEAQRILGLDPGNSRAHDILGIVAGRQGLNDEAVKEFSESIRCDSTNAEAYNDLGILYERMGRSADALAMYRSAARLNPKSADAQFNVGTSLAQQGNLEEAASCWLRCLELSPSYAGARLNLGKLYAMQGKIDEAGRQFTAILLFDPKNVQAHFNYGNLLASQSKFAAAEYHLSEAVRLPPRSVQPKMRLIEFEHKKAANLRLTNITFCPGNCREEFFALIRREDYRIVARSVGFVVEGLGSDDAIETVPRR